MSLIIAIVWIMRLDFILTLVMIFFDEFAREVNIFLRQCGYPSYNKDTVFLKSITDEELEELEDYLETIRNKGEA